MKYYLAVLIPLTLTTFGRGQEWNSYRKDESRSGFTEIELDASRLAPSWTWQSPIPPSPAWDGPARWDAYNRIKDLPAMRQYDGCFHCVSDGKDVFFGSSSQDALFSLNLGTGERNWTFVAGGPVRLAPTIADDCVLFGCDDGYVYCVDKEAGKLIWKFNPSKYAGSSQRRVISNNRLISCFPIRTAVSVREGIAYFGASLLPWRESYICAIDLTTGAIDESKNTYVRKHQNATLEGNLLVTEDKLIVPQGRVAPLIFERVSGKNLGSLPGGGGVFVVLTDSGELVRAEGGGPARSGQVGVFRGKERVASFARGRSIVVSDENYFVIDGEKLFAASRKNNELHWSREVDEPVELIMASDTLFVGGRDHVTAVDSKTGAVIWTGNTVGRAFGLAIADNRLIVSTDTGSVYTFAPTTNKRTIAETKTEKKERTWKSPKVNRVRENTITNRWVFHRSAMKNKDQSNVTSTNLKDVFVKDQASNVHLHLNGKAKIVPTNESLSLESVQLSGDFFPMPELAAAGLPTRAITAEAWVRIDDTQAWGSIVGNFRDDGPTETGWLLGYQDDRFCFGLAGGDNGLTYLQADNAFQTKAWNHVVGSYNGKEMRLYVNGSLAASSTAESGPIHYGDKSYFSVGAYRDTDESFPMLGAIHEISIYSVAMSASRVKRLFESKANKFERPETTETVESDRFVSWGPYSRYIYPGEIEITYGTFTSKPTVVELVMEDGIRRFSNELTTKEHKIVVDGLPHRRELQFQIRGGYSKKAEQSESYSLDSHFDWTPRKHKNPSHLLTTLVDLAPNPRGIVLVDGSELKEQAMELADCSEFSVVLMVEDQGHADEIRAEWIGNDEIAYGEKICVSTEKLDDLPGAFAAIVFSSKNSGNVRRLVRPEGGVLFDGESLVWNRGSVNGSGVWTHMYGTMDNSAFGGEHLANATDREDLITQWIGRPGPRYKTDRQNRRPSPLAVGGRMYLQGQQRMIGLDAYTGSVLWSAESPTVMRWNVPHDSANWCADDQGVYVAAQHQAWFIDGKNGELKTRYELPLKKSKKQKYWGFIGRYENLLIGSIVEAPAIYTKWWGSSQWFDSTSGEDTHVVGGDALFALDVETGMLVWKHNGLVLHPTITVLDGRICFIQDTTDAHIKSDNRRISLDEDQSHQLVALDVASGDLLWQRSFPRFEGHLSSLYLAGGGDEESRSLISVASVANKKHFSINSFNPIDGSGSWSQTVTWESTHHGKHISRPAIQGDLIYIRPEVLNLIDGKSIQRGFPGGHGCSSYTAFTNGIFSRLGETTWWDARTKKVNRFKRIRTDCWISVIPAQGMLLSAEGGGGCSCGTWLETSLGFLPKAIDEALPADE